MSGSDEDEPEKGEATRKLPRSFVVSGQLLSSLRMARGWTQLEAAERAGISERVVRKAEAGGRLGLRSIAILAQLYSTPDAPLSPDQIAFPDVGAPRERISGDTDVAAISRRWHQELWNEGRLSIIEELAAPDCVLHADGKRVRGRAAVRRYVDATRVALSRSKLVVKEVRVYGDLVVTQWHVRLKRPEPDLERRFGQRRRIRGSTWIRVDGGTLCEIWQAFHVALPRAKAR